MELKKTTILSALVCIAGFLAEVIFHDTMTDSVFGVVLGVVLGLMVVGSGYFVLDGVFTMVENLQKSARKYQEDYEKRMYAVLDEQLKFQKATYKEICQLAQMQESYLEEEKTVEKATETIAKPEDALAVSQENMDQLIQSINDNTMMAAKIIAKYISKNTVELKSEISGKEDKMEELCTQLEQIQGQIQQVLATMEKKGTRDTKGTQIPNLNALDVLQLEENPTVETVNAIKDREAIG